MDKHSPNFTACQININTLSSHCHMAVDKYIHDRNIDVLALQEVGFNSITNGSNIFTNRATFMNAKNENCSGVLLSIAHEMEPAKIQELMAPNLDCVWVSIKINSIQYLIGSVYARPENIKGSKTSKTLEDLLANIKLGKEWCDKNKHQGMLVYGDYNARSFNWGDVKENNRGKQLSKFIVNENMVVCTPSDKTFVCTSTSDHSQGGSVIDLVLGHGKILDKLNQQWIDYETELFTGAPGRGHYPVFQTISLNRKGDTNMGTSTKMDLENTDWQNWQDTLDEEIEEVHKSIESFTNPLALWEALSGVINRTNTKALCTKKISKHSKPYWSESLSTLSKEVQYARKSMKARYTPVNKEKLSNAVEKFKEELILHKNMWVRKRAEALNTANATEFWKRYKTVFGCTSEKSISNLRKNGKLATNNSDREELLFNTFFEGEHLENQPHDSNHNASITLELNQIKHMNWNIESPPNNPESQETEKDSINMNGMVTVQEVKRSIKEQGSSGKSPDPDKIHPRMLKNFTPKAIDVLCKLINLAMDTGIWPWNNNCVSFLRKDGKPDYGVPGAYRPITMSSYIGKIGERILENRLRNHCIYHNIIDESQEGFREKRSTTRYLYNLVSSLHEIKRRKLCAIILFIDFEKAFDSVAIPDLIVKLHRYGVQGKILRLINNFLCHRKVCLIVNGCIGAARHCKQIGLPQGSVISPLLFIIFIADLIDPRHMPDTLKALSQVHKFADDGTVLTVADNLQQCKEQMQMICDYLFTWCKRWKMVINCAKNKTEAIILKTKNITSTLDIPKLKIGNQEILYVAKTKVLGVILDKDLNFKPHAASVISSCWYIWHHLKRNSRREWGINLANMTLLFKTLILSKLLYGSPVWLYPNRGMFQDFWARAILGITGSEYHPKNSLASLAIQLPPLEVLNQIVCLKFALKCLSGTDELRSCMLQLDENTKHPYYRHCLYVKQFLNWKRSSRINVKTLNLIDIEPSEFIYTKEQMKIYTNTVWKNRTDLNELETEHQKLFNPATYGQAWLFNKTSTRKEDSILMDFLHGHATRFSNFAVKVKHGNSNRNTCKHCKDSSDSPQHQLLHCIAFEGQERSSFKERLTNHSKFNLEVILSDDSDIYDKFRNVVKFISNKPDVDLGIIDTP